MVHDGSSGIAVNELVDLSIFAVSHHLLWEPLIVVDGRKYDICLSLFFSQ